MLQINFCYIESNYEKLFVYYTLSSFLYKLFFLKATHFHGTPFIVLLYRLHGQ